MVKKLKLKKIQGTVYYEPEVLEYLEECMESSGRKISAEVNYIVKTIKKNRENNDLAAANMAEAHFSTAGQDNQPQT